jgi:hypothetical protein
MLFIQYFIAVLPVATSASVLRRIADSATVLVERAALPPAGPVDKPPTATKTATVPAVTPTTPVTVDLSSLFSIEQTNFDGIIPSGQHRTGTPEVSWQPYSTLGDVVKSRTTKEHANGDVAIRVAIPLSVNTAIFCPADGGHAIYYIFPGITAGKLHLSVDSWDTLTNDNNLCQNGANNELKSWVGTKMPALESLVNQWMPSRTNFINWTIQPQNYNNKLDVQVTAAST